MTPPEFPVIGAICCSGRMAEQAATILLPNYPTRPGKGQHGSECIDNHHPILLVEMVKVDKLRACLESFDYSVFEAGLNFLALHKTDKCLAHVEIKTLAKP